MDSEPMSIQVGHTITTLAEVEEILSALESRIFGSGSQIQGGISRAPGSGNAVAVPPLQDQVCEVRSRVVSIRARLERIHTAV